MHRVNTLILPVLVLLAVHACGQKTTYKGKKLTPLRSYNDPSLVRAKAGSTVPLFDEAGFPYTGIGIRLGDPAGFTFKFYFSEHVALAADFGRVISPLYKTYYSGLFGLYFPDPADTLSYASHNAKSDWAGELKLLYHISAKNIMKGLQFYVGPGWQVRDAKLDFLYITKEPAAPGAFQSQRRHQTQGVTFTAGAEYANFSIPLSLFLEAGCYYDLSKDKGWTRLQGGVGVRYVF